ncbi:MAG TPA: immunoglobulin domain-containing protein, partial [Opitutaceae bacterium]|nr:immunoglobulin domain-containing protein [Opitutaceae bacterium]
MNACIRSHRRSTSPGSIARALALFAAALIGNGLRAQSNYATPYTFTTLAGSPGNAGYVDGTGLSARLGLPKGVAVDSAGDLYIIDAGSETIRKITPAGVVTHFAGLPANLQPTPVNPEIAPVGGDANTALFRLLQGIAIDSSGTLYVTGNGFIRMITPAGNVTTVAGGANSLLVSPTGIAADNQGNLIVTDSSTDVILRVDIATGVVSNYAGFATQFGSADGTGSAARFSAPQAVAVDASGNAYIADSGGTKVRKIAPGGIVTTLAGSSSSTGSADGTGAAAQFVAENGIAVDTAGNVYVTEANNTVREVTQAGVVTTLAGTANTGGSANGSGAAALFNDPYGIAVDAAGDMFVTDLNNDTVRERYAAANSSPSVTSQPASQSVSLGSAATFSVTGSGVPVPNYQWLFDGAYLTGATNPTLTVSNVQASNLGSYSVILSSSSGTVTSDSATLSSPGITPVVPSSTTGSEFANISTRALVQSGTGTEIVGFVISGPGGSTEQVLIRADGPSLSLFSVSGHLENPVLTLFDSSGAQIATNSDWSASSNASQIAAAAAAVGAFSLPAGEAGVASDSALLLNLAPGAYTAQVTSQDGSSGVALAEVYQVGAGSASLINVSTRAFVSTGTSAEIAGLVIRGSQSAQVLIRAVGPTLSQF